MHLLTDVPYTVTAHAKDIYRHAVDWALASRIAAAAEVVVTVCDANLAYLADRLDGSGHVTGLQRTRPAGAGGAAL
ncbi:MAG: hypothetical protein R2713_13675 [Ilumatobacteraceae bacterium]